MVGKGDGEPNTESENENIMKYENVFANQIGGNTRTEYKHINYYEVKHSTSYGEFEGKYYNAKIINSWYQRNEDVYSFNDNSIWRFLG